jgi:hypothetical protein
VPPEVGYGDPTLFGVGVAITETSTATSINNNGNTGARSSSSSTPPLPSPPLPSHPPVPFPQEHKTCIRTDRFNCTRPCFPLRLRAMIFPLCKSYCIEKIQNAAIFPRDVTPNEGRIVIPGALIGNILLAFGIIFQNGIGRSTIPRDE